MADLKAQIQADMIAAMKAHEDVKVGALRMLKAAILKEEVSGTRSEVNEEKIVQIIKREIKQRKEAAEQFQTGNRPELAEKEMAEMKILEEYLPAQMSEERVREVVQKVVAEVGATGPADFGKVMKAVMAELQGKADGALVKQVLESVLKQS